MSDLLLTVRQIANYASRTASDGSEQLLVQVGGLGGPYQSISASTLLSTGLASGSLGVGTSVPVNADAGQVFADGVATPTNGWLGWNLYEGGGVGRYLASGPAALLRWGPTGLSFDVAPSGQAGTPVQATQPHLRLASNGNLALPLGTLTVARDPAAANEVATLRWVGANTVGSLNGRRGAVTLLHDDVTRALGVAADDRVATVASVHWAIQETLRTHPFVWSWNGRCGNVWLTVDDTNAVMAGDGAAPLASLAPPGDSSARIANTAWVSRLLYGKFWSELAKTYAPLASPVFIGKPTAPEPPLTSNDASLATTEWVRRMIGALAAGVMSWNGRSGFVDLELSDIEALFTAPGNTPLVNKPLATAVNGEIVNAEWTIDHVDGVRQDIVDNSVWTFNTRKGDITLTLADLRSAEGQRRLFIGVNPPANPQASDTWMDSTDPTGGVLYVWYVDGTPGQWVALSGGAAGPMGAQGNPGPPGPTLRPMGTVPSLGALLALPGPHQGGDLYLVTSTNESFAWNDSANQWVSLGQIGQAFPDAPQDGGMYARQNGLWVRLANDGVY